MSYNSLGQSVNIYKIFIKPILFLFPPEIAHKIAKLALSINPVWRILKPLLNFKDNTLNTTIAGIQIQNPVGLAAGYDKDCATVKSLANLGFGYVVVGTILINKRSGNPKPRIVRNPKDFSIINSLGFPTQGLRYAINKINNANPVDAPIFASISGFSIEDFVRCQKILQPITAGIELNISSPNTEDIRVFQDLDQLENLLSHLNKTKEKPIFLKTPMYFDKEGRDSVMGMIDLCIKHSIDGITASNTWPIVDARLAVGKGGLSGRPLFEHTIRIVKEIREHAGNNLYINACGGISSGEDVLIALDAGANTVQLYTEFIYEGPGLIGRINRDIVRLKNEI